MWEAGRLEVEDMLWLDAERLLRCCCCCEEFLVAVIEIGLSSGGAGGT